MNFYICAFMWAHKKRKRGLERKKVKNTRNTKALREGNRRRKR